MRTRRCSRGSPLTVRRFTLTSPKLSSSRRPLRRVSADTRYRLAPLVSLNQISCGGTRLCPSFSSTRYIPTAVPLRAAPQPFIQKVGGSFRYRCSRRLAGSFTCSSAGPGCKYGSPLPSSLRRLTLVGWPGCRMVSMSAFLCSHSKAVLTLLAPFPPGSGRSRSAAQLRAGSETS